MLTHDAARQARLQEERRLEAEAHAKEVGEEQNEARLQRQARMLYTC